MKAILSSLSDIPEALRGEYEQRDGKYVLKLDGDYPGFVKAGDLAEAHQKLIEFRDTNIGLKRIHDEQAAKLKAFEGIDPDEHRKLKEKMAEIEKLGVKGGHDVSTIVQKALAEAVGPLQKQLQELTEREQNVKGQLARKEIETVLTQEGLKAGVREEALPDYLRRGLEVWKLEDGKPVAYNGNAQSYSKKQPAELLSPAEWVSVLSSEAPHLFKLSKGGGANPGAGGNGERMTYNSNDPADFLKNIDKIAKGEMIPIEPT